MKKRNLVEIKIDKKRFVILFLALAISLISSLKIYSYIFPQEQNVSYVIGEVEIFVNGIWIPLKAGVDISNATIRVKKGTEMRIGDKIIRSEDDDAEFSISQKGEFIVEKGTLIVSKEGEEEKEKQIINVKTPDVKTPEKELKESEKIQEKTELTKSDEPQKYPGEQSTEEVFPRIVRVSIKDAEERDGIKFLKTRKAKIEVEIENIDEVRIGNIVQIPKSGKVETVIYLNEGENKIDITGLDSSGKIIDTRSEIVYVDTKPPEVKIPKKIKFQ